MLKVCKNFSTQLIKLHDSQLARIDGEKTVNIQLAEAGLKGRGGFCLGEGGRGLWDMKERD